jgi:dipeptidyl aminopeptidase/acylaminoacyl peptidase
MTVTSPGNNLSLKFIQQSCDSIISVHSNSKNCRMRKISSLFLFLMILQSVHAQNGSEPMRVTDMLRIKRPDNITLSKDGSKAAFTLNSIIPDPASKADFKYVTQIYVVATDGSSSPRQLTTASDGASQPAWSPDGRQLVFVRASEGKAQLFLLSMDGGEPRQLTKHAYGASNPVWSPDGKKILFSGSISLKDMLRDSVLNVKDGLPAWSLERPGFSKNNGTSDPRTKADPDGNLEQVRAWLSENEKDRKAVVFNKLNFQSETNVSPDLNFAHIFVINADTAAMPQPVTRGFARFANADFAPNGRHIILSGDLDSLQHPDRSLESEIFIADADGSNLRKILGEEGKSYNSPRISPSGKWLAFQYGNTSFVSIPTLAIMPVDGSAKDIVNIPFDRSKSNFNWSQDEKFLYFSAQSNGGAPIYRVEIKTKKVQQLGDYDAGILSYDISGDKIVFVKTAVANPGEVYLADKEMKVIKPLSSFNGWVKMKKLSVPEKKTFTNEKGQTIEYWTMKPAGYETGKKYPVLLNIHGGPSAMWGPGEASMWHEFQFFCSQGYGVVYCNPRGSGGYGLDFLRANINDWGTGPTSDVLTSLDKAVSENWIDTSKMVVSGGSYAGYLVAWIISHDKRFKAASSQRGVYDLATFFGEGNAWRLVPNYFGGYPWQPEVQKVLQRESPISYVNEITTPYLIFHGDNDRRTGFVQSEMLYRSLKVLGRPVEYVRHPNATHELTRSGDNRQRIDQMLRTYEFFERWIR